ncbi:hypothetical protein XAP412_1040027 [Xanthomonas phaseoli pv. phaseoli]|uniref:Uncharacterized protein n=1 Tax=Xanthomonas campestris pv. phaseoli TaxID=317013 RepID=A0AB38DU82_XANCH|nr:hypothetical protein XAP412_1040027 [Xanthomonas phaseoli pv. phaseoli]SON75929.1 hypothetical protein XAP6984_1090026 [Xanthomonas phaseoli pv. phaseoli]SON77639.1 hypothetical protein XAP7430_1060028 [Xanthomonas phaseoli pv. phaseoli]SOO30492.1 hypothetical protein XAP6164_4430006 [Xanthomonas phaseoli pv. phaseoli]
MTSLSALRQPRRETVPAAPAARAAVWWVLASSAPCPVYRSTHDAPAFPCACRHLR